MTEWLFAQNEHQVTIVDGRKNLLAGHLEVGSGTYRQLAIYLVVSSVKFDKFRLIS